MTDTAPFRELELLAQEELRLVTEGRWEDLAELAVRRAAAHAALPSDTPRSAVPHLREAQRVQGLVTAMLQIAHDEARTNVLGLDRTRAGVQGYGAGAAQRRVGIDLVS